jgi:hypothetical protein
MKAVYTADNPIQAYTVKNFLEAEGIPAVVVGEGMFPLRGYGASFSADSLPQVCVTNDEDAPRALELLRAHRAPPDNGPHPCANPVGLQVGEGGHEGSPAAPEEPTPQAGRLWVRWILLLLLCWFAARLLRKVWYLLSLWLGLTHW